MLSIICVLPSRIAVFTACVAHHNFISYRPSAAYLWVPVFVTIPLPDLPTTASAPGVAGFPEIHPQSGLLFGQPNWYAGSQTPNVRFPQLLEPPQLFQNPAFPRSVPHPDLPAEPTAKPISHEWVSLCTSLWEIIAFLGVYTYSIGSSMVTICTGLDWLISSRIAAIVVDFP